MATARALFFIPLSSCCFAVSLCGTMSFYAHRPGARYKYALVAVNNERRDCVARATLMRRVKCCGRAALSAAVLFQPIALWLEDAAELARDAGLRKPEPAIGR